MADLEEQEDEEEIQELLHMKLEGLGQLDIMEDEAVDPKVELAKKAKQVNPNAYNNIKTLARGQKGIEQLAESEIVKNIETDLETPLEDGPKGKSLSESVTQIKAKDRTVAYKDDVHAQYNNAIKTIENLYRALANGHIVSHQNILKVVEGFVKIFTSDRSILLNLNHGHDKSEDYLFAHVLRVSLTAMNIATSCGYSRRQVLEAGEAGLLADIGMMLVPDEIRLKPEKLGKDEMLDIHKHPMVGLHVAEKISNLPKTIAYVTYQHHERLSGVGYPKGRKGPVIHNYSKIVAIADVFEAIRHHRPHRKSVGGYEAMVRIMKMAKAGLLDPYLTKNFVRYMSLFPIGSLVKLSDERLAKVIEANPDFIDKPILSVLTQPGGKLLPKEEIYQIDLARQEQLKIVRALEEQVQEIKLMDGL